MTPADSKVAALRQALETAARGLLPVDAPVGDPGELRLAAVLVGLQTPESGACEPDALELVMMERAHSLRTHAGQIAFPGGKHESADSSLLHTALREAEEEIGLIPHSVEILGRLTPVPTPSGFWVVPFVGWITRPQPWVLDPREVARLVVAPVRELRDKSRWEEEGVRRFRDQDFVLYRFRLADADLWGASARMVDELLRRMAWL